jgi:hypothetical protein
VNIFEFYSLLDEYRRALLTSHPVSHTHRQERIDKARLAIIAAFEHKNEPALEHGNEGSQS